jgi:hypothetical protein
MKLPLLVTCLLLLSTVYSFAQDNKAPFQRSTYIKVNPTTLINELDISLEQELSEKLSLELGVSGIYTDYPDYLLSKKIDIGQKKPDISTEQYVDGRGLGFRAGLRWYLFSARDGLYRAMGTYFEPVLIYKKVFYPNQDIVINDDKFKRSATKDVYAFQILLGRQITKDKVVFDPYIGLGVRTKVYRYQNFTDNNGAAMSNDGRLVSVLPSIQLGIKIGLKL